MCWRQTQLLLKYIKFYFVLFFICMYSLASVKIFFLYNVLRLCLFSVTFLHLLRSQTFLFVLKYLSRSTECFQNSKYSVELQQFFSSSLAPAHDCPLLFAYGANNLRFRYFLLIN